MEGGLPRAPSAGQSPTGTRSAILQDEAASRATSAAWVSPLEREREINVLWKVCRVLARLCVLGLVAYAVSIGLLLAGFQAPPAWWFWSICIWIGVPYLLMFIDLAVTTDLSLAEKRKWRRELYFGLLGYVVPLFYFLGARGSRKKLAKSLLVVIAVLLTTATGCKGLRSAAAVNRAGPLYQQGRYAEALDLYREAVRLDPEFGAAHCGMGNTLRALGRYHEAIESYERALRLEPNAIRCRYPLAVLLYETGERDRAEAECDTTRQGQGFCECKVFLAVSAERGGAQAARLVADYSRKRRPRSQDASTASRARGRSTSGCEIADYLTLVCRLPGSAMSIRHKHPFVPCAPR
jgi:tetratricopeptide (TPR) repeat protein